VPWPRWCAGQPDLYGSCAGRWPTSWPRWRGRWWWPSHGGVDLGDSAIKISYDAGLDTEARLDVGTTTVDLDIARGLVLDMRLGEKSISPHRVQRHEDGKPGR